MQRSLITLFLLICIGLSAYVTKVEAGLFSWGGDSLLKIDGQEYTATDFKNWWDNWREKDQPLPQTMDPYIDWLLLAKEAERMMLFDDPAYYRDNNTYLKVLSLVQLKHDEIDSKVNITDEMLKARYDALYVPFWLYNIIVVKDRDTAELLYTDLVAGKINVDDLARFAEINKPVPQGHPVPEKSEMPPDEKLIAYPGLDTQLLGVHQNVKRRPISSEKSWLEILRGLDKGAYAKPFPWQEGYVIIQLLDRFDGDQDDFDRQKSNILSKYRKNEQGRLTIELIEKLKKKYGVTINEERVNAIDPDSPDMHYTDAPLITIGDMTISEKQVMEKVNKDLETNKMYGFTGSGSKDVLLRVVNGIVGQTLITLESLDRHYENNPSIKVLLEFKRKHALVKKLEQQIRDQVSKVSDEDITAYYNAHLQDEYTGPDMYKMALIKGTEEDLNKLWLDVVINGSDVMAAAEKRLGTRPVVQTYPADHLEKVVLENITSLNKGDVSKVFPLQDGFAMIYMVAFSPSEIAPLEKVKNHVRQQLLQERYDEVRNKYVQDLRDKSTIEINDTAWTKLKAELIKEK